LFTKQGYKTYAEDLLKRMTNPYLDDTIERGAEVLRLIEQAASDDTENEDEN